jgi:hypothetical protein
MEEARALGLNTIRVVAFNDGAVGRYAVQVRETPACMYQLGLKKWAPLSKVAKGPTNSYLFIAEDRAQGRAEQSTARWATLVSCDCSLSLQHTLMISDDQHEATHDLCYNRAAVLLVGRSK